MGTILLTAVAQHLGLDAALEAAAVRVHARRDPLWAVRAPLAMGRDISPTSSISSSAPMPPAPDRTVPNPRQSFHTQRASVNDRSTANHTSGTASDNGSSRTHRRRRQAASSRRLGAGSSGGGDGVCIGGG